MAATDNKTNLYVDGAVGSNVNGGSNDGVAKETYANVDAALQGGTVYHLDNNNGGAGWGTTADDDVICYDTGANIEFCKVTDITAGGGDADVIEVDAAPSGGLTDLAGVNVNVGGAWSTMNFACAMVESTNWLNIATDPITIWVKGGAYPELATIGNISSATLTTTLEGYKDNVGDGWDQVFTDLPKMDGNGNTVNVGIRSGVGNANLNWSVKHIWVNDSSGGGIFATTATDQIRVMHCKMSGNTGWGGQCDGDSLWLYNEVSGNGSGGIDCDASTIVFGNEIFGNGATGVEIQGGVVVGNLIYDHTGSNICNSAISSRTLLCAYNTIDGIEGDNAAAIGIDLNDTSPSIMLVAFNYIHDCETGLSSAVLSGLAESFYNWIGNCTTPTANWILGEGDDSAGATDPGFIGEGASNYQPDATSPANGSAGPTTLPRGLTTTNNARGAAEPATVSGSGAALSRVRLGM